MKYEKYGNSKQADLNLYICGMDENLPPGIKYGPVIRDSYIIECCTSGYGSVIINGREFMLKPRDCFVLIPGDVIIHTADTVHPRSGVWCGVKGIKISNYLSALGITSDQPFAPPEAFDGVVAQLNKMCSMIDDNDAGADLRRQSCCHALFGELMRYTNQSADTGSYIQRAFAIMEMRYAEELSVNDIATELGLERCYFSTLFKKKTGKTPHAYLSELRIKKSCALLLDSDLSISETARAVGIDPICFARVFKKQMGIVPGRYKKEKSYTQKNL